MDELAAPEILTPSLTLRPFAAADVDGIRRIWTHVEVRRFLFDDERVSSERVESMLAESRSGFETRSFGIWVARERGDDTPVGTTGFWPFRDPPVIEIFWALSRPVWGRGLASEMSRAMLGWGFDALGFESIRACVDAPNVSSLALAERLGMQRDRVDREARQIHYRLDRADRP